MIDRPDDAAPSSTAASVPATAGAWLRQARQSRGLHIVALADQIKVPPQKLEALEDDRLEDLPGTAFARALAQTVCRALKVDPAPVLALMPHGADRGLDRMSQTLNAPYRDKPGRRVPRDWGLARNPAVIGAGLLVFAALVVYVLPDGLLPSWETALGSGATADVPAETAAREGAPTPAATADVAASPTAASSAEPALTATPMIETVHSAPNDGTATASPGTAAPASGALQFRASGESWVEVTDRRGQVLFSRLLLAGETVGVDGTPPLRVKVGNAAVTAVVYRGQPVDLGGARNNVVQLDLK